MNIAWKDVRRQWERFALTSLGIGILFAIVLAMGGIYRGLVDDATLLVDAVGADLWLVQRDTRGPFAERSVVPASLEDRARMVPGVASARAFVTANVQRDFQGRSLRLSLVGLSWPDDRGDGVPLSRGRALQAAHREMIADASTGLRIGDHVPLADDIYEVVGVTRGMVASSGDGLVFVTASDLQAIQSYVPAEAVRLDRLAAQAREPRPERDDAIGRDAPGSDALFARPAPPPINAVIVKLEAGSRADARRVLDRWSDVTVYSSAEQRDLLLFGVVDKARKQIGLFRALLVVVSAIIVSLIVYTMTTSKAHEIALLKLMGARTRVVLGLVLQESLMLGALGYALAVVVSRVSFQYFPRRVLLTIDEYVGVGAIVLFVCVVASIAGIAKALRIPATSVLSG